MISFLNPTGPFTFITGAAALVENILVEVHTDGTLIKCGADRAPVGFVQYAYAIGITATVYPACGEAVIKAGATPTIAIGDYCKVNSEGKLVSNGASASTANDIKTVAIALSVGTAEDDFVKVKFIRAC